MSRITLVHWHADEAQERAERLVGLRRRRKRKNAESSGSIAVGRGKMPNRRPQTGRASVLLAQITAVYEVMLPRPPLRFLLADDPGAGKTIMAGLLVKELIVRGDLQINAQAPASAPLRDYHAPPPDSA